MIHRPNRAAGLALAAFLLAIAGGRAGQPAHAQVSFEPFLTIGGVPEVIDGDRIAVDGRIVRLYGIDAPEPGQTCRTGRGRPYDCGEAAQAMLRRLIGPNDVTCTVYSSPSGMDAMVGRCNAGGVDLGGALVARGWAWRLPSLSDRYGREQSMAQAHRRGIWSGPNVPAWTWRARREAE